MTDRPNNRCQVCGGKFWPKSMNDDVCSDKCGLEWDRLYALGWRHVG